MDVITYSFEATVFWQGGGGGRYNADNSFEKWDKRRNDQWRRRSSSVWQINQLIKYYCYMLPINVMNHIHVYLQTRELVIDNVLDKMKMIYLKVKRSNKRSNGTRWVSLHLFSFSLLVVLTSYETFNAKTNLEMFMVKGIRACREKITKLWWHENKACNKTFETLKAYRL